MLNSVNEISSNKEKGDKEEKLRQEELCYYYHNIYICDIIDFAFKCGLSASRDFNNIKNPEVKQAVMEKALCSLMERVTANIDEEETKKFHSDPGNYRPYTVLKSDSEIEFSDCLKQIIINCESDYQEWQEFITRRLKEGIRFEKTFKGIELKNTYPGTGFYKMDEIFKSNESFLMNISKEILGDLINLLNFGFYKEYKDNISQKKIPTA